MIKIILILGLIIYSSAYLSEETFKYEIKSALQKGLSSQIKTHISNLSKLIEKSISPMKIPTRGTRRLYLNSTVIVNALTKLKSVLPERVPMIPFAVAEPISNNMLYYFAILNSSFVNLTLYDPKATVNNTATNTSIEVNLHINTSSLEGHYEVDVSNYDMHLFGDGNYSVVSNNTNLQVKININIFEDNTFQMTEFRANISISSAKMILTNLLDGDSSVQPLLDLISTMMPAEVATIMDMIQTTVNRMVVGMVNKYVASIFTWNDMVWIIDRFSKQ